MGVTMKTISKNLKETRKLAAHFIENVSPNKNKATIVLLSGDLGTGKTAFVKSAAKAFGIKHTITSPTFVIEKVYRLPKRKPFSKLVHIDAYRLKGGKELRAIHWSDIEKDPEAIVFIEWPENVKDVVPRGAEKFSFKFIDDTTRAITWHKSKKRN